MKESGPQKLANVVSGLEDGLIARLRGYRRGRAGEGDEAIVGCDWVRIRRAPWECATQVNKPDNPPITIAA
jgi:hypothetical protein